VGELLGRECQLLIRLAVTAENRINLQSVDERFRDDKGV
jgi:hypothetical protein